MARRIVTTFVLALLLTSSAAAADDELTVSALVRQVKSALLTVQQSASASTLPPLKQAILRIRTGFTVAGDGEIHIFVISFGARAKNYYSSEIEIVLTPPSKDSSSNVSIDSLGDSLAKAIIAAANAIEKAQKGDPPLILKTLDARVAFTVERSGRGGFQINFPPFSGRGGSEISSSQVHSIEVIYGD